MKITLQQAQADLEAQAEEILNQPGVHPDCWLARCLASVRRYRQELESVRAKGAEGRELRLATKHVGQFEGVLRNILEETKEDLQFFRDNAEELEEAISAGEEYYLTDWGGGWEWKALVIKVGDRLVQVHNTGFSLYCGQNGKALVTRSFGVG